MNAEPPFARLAARIRRPGSESGAALTHVAVALVGLMAFTSFAMGYGVMWLSRRQAQNSADAGALAGAISLSYEAPGTTGPTDPPAVGATTVALENLVWGQSPSVDPNTDVTIGCMVGNACQAVGLPCTPGVDTCVRVDAYRSGARGNPLPTFFAQLVGVTSQDIRATATARVRWGNATKCLKPWAVADKWDEYEGDQDYPGHDPDFWNAGPPDTRPGFQDNMRSDVTFDPYENKSPEPDVYVPPSESGPGTSFRVRGANGTFCCDYGKQFRLKISEEENRISSGWFMAIRLDGSAGGADYAWNIKNCNGATYEIGQALPLSTEPGNKVGPTRHAVETDPDSLVNKDPTARWEPTALGGIGAVVSDTYGINQSPRMVPVPVFNIDEYLATDPDGRSTVVVRNIVGFFVEGMCGSGNKEVCGRIVPVPGEFVEEGPDMTSSAAFLQVIQLIR